MSYRLEYLDIAELELSDALEKYNAISPNLSASFFMILDDLLLKIKENPRLFPFIHKEMRRVPIMGFPYSIIYEIHGPDVVLIIGIVPQKSNPKRWMKR